MQELELTIVELQPSEGVSIKLKDGYAKCMVFYNVAAHAPLQPNAQLLDAELQGDSIECRNHDVTFPHELCIMQFNQQLPPVFQIAPWQILLMTKRERV